MEEMRYTISDAAKMVKVESHVLRYWEDELSLEIPRNEMGHRYYTQKEIDIFCQIRALKDKGLPLKSIKDVMEIVFDKEKATNIISLENVRQNYEEDTEKDNKTNESKALPAVSEKENIPEKTVSAAEKMHHFKYIMDAIIMQALQNNNQTLEENITELVTERLMREMDVIEQQREQKEEVRFRKLDEAIRGRQRNYSEVAAAKIPPYTPTKMNKRRFGLFRKV